MRMPKPPTVDFETFGIEGRPKYPPKPVGVSIKPWGKKSKYYAFGHPTNNNCTEAEAKRALKAVWNHPDGVIFQNAKFDVDVAVEHWNMKMLPWDKIHDTMFLLFLHDPHQIELGLKPSAERLLGWKPEEQDACEEWLIENQPIPFVKISRSKKSPHYFGKYLAYVPGDLGGKYAEGDTDRTNGLFKLLWKDIHDRDMLVAYDRERELMPILLEMEQQGLPVAHRRLKRDVKKYTQAQIDVDKWIKKRIKAPDDINLDSGAQLIDAMVESGKANPDIMPRTPTGKLKSSKDSLLIGVSDKVLLSMLKYRAQLKTCMGTFMVPWLKVADESGGLIFTNWNQTKQDGRGGSAVGTRTGRLSSTPNFQNIPNEFKPLWAHEKKGLPKCPIAGLPPLPKIRGYVIPFPGHVFIDRDYSQQEPRILAHFDGGELMDTYNEDPWIDFHSYAQEELARMGKYYERKPVKDTNLGVIYAMGLGKLAEKTGLPVDETKTLKNAIMALYPGLKEMYKDMKIRSKNDLPIRTWGGREYYCEPPKIIDGRIKTFDYKMVNLLIQGSAADCTKEAIIRFYRKRRRAWLPLLNVHDQVTASVPKEDLHIGMEALRVALESVEFDVPMFSEGTWSKTDWENLKEYDTKGVMAKGIRI